MTPELTDRLRFELKTIKEMGFADYFLIVWDFIHFAKQNGVSVGPGRGSAAGSIAAYCLEITDVDPMRYGLLFERFLNPARKDLPDMDIDFSVAGRDRVINYVAEKYGRDRVAQIITFSTMAARAAIRDAGRVLDIPYGVVDRIAKLVPEGPGQTLEAALKPGAELRQAVDSDPIAKEIIDLARPLEGLTRADSIHAAGVVIGAQPLIEVVPLQQKGADSEMVTQVGMNDVVDLGLLKMDFLGLRNLDVIDKAVELVGGVDIGTLPLDDPKTYAMLARGDSTGVFQFESSGMREALRSVKPTEFEDLIALVALYRPGPMGYIPMYAARKAGREQVSFADTRLEAITGQTYAICIYQEQYMQIAKELAGFSPAEAETLRKAIGKKIHALMASLKDQFLEGCAENSVAAGRRAAAVEGHGVVAGLLLQQGARRLLRAHRLPHGVAEGEPPEGVHGRAHLVGDEHEGPRAALRQRVPRDGHRRPATGRELVAAGLRGRRRRHPLRAQRGEERGGGRSGRDRPRPGRGWAVRVDLGAHRARRSAGAQQARARVAREVRCARLHRRDAAGHAHRPRRGARARAADVGRPARRPGLHLRRRLRRRGAVRRGQVSAARDHRVRRARALAPREGDARPVRLGASARTRPCRAEAEDGLRPDGYRAQARRRVRHRRRDRLRAEAGDDEARRADGVRDARRPDGQCGGRRLQLDVRQPRASSSSPTASSS